MSAFGLTPYTIKFARAIIVNGGAKLTNKLLAAVDALAGELHGWAVPYNLEDAFHFLYPFVGGSAIAHSFNLADPSVARIAWEGTVTHDANGITGNGTNGGGDTGIGLSGGSSAHMVMAGVYCRTANTRDSFEIANNNGGTSAATIAVACRWTSNLARFWHSSYLSGSWTVTIWSSSFAPSSQGMFAIMRTSTTDVKTGVGAGGSSQVVTPSATTVNAFSTLNFHLLSDTDGGNRSNRNLAFAFLTNSAVNSTLHTAAAFASFYTIIQRFQTRLGRQV